MDVNDICEEMTRVLSRYDGRLERPEILQWIGVGIFFGAVGFALVCWLLDRYLLARDKKSAMIHLD